MGGVCRLLQQEDLLKNRNSSNTTTLAGDDVECGKNTPTAHDLVERVKGENRKIL